MTTRVLKSFIQTHLMFGDPIPPGQHVPDEYGGNPGNGALPRAPVRVKTQPPSIPTVARDHPQLFEEVLGAIRDHFRVRRDQFNPDAEPVFEVRGTGSALPPCPSDGVAYIAWRKEHFIGALPQSVRDKYTNAARPLTDPERKTITAAINRFLTETRAKRALENGIAAVKQDEKLKRPVLPEATVATDVFSIRNPDGQCKDVQRFMTTDTMQADETTLVDRVKPAPAAAPPPMTSVADREVARPEAVNEILGGIPVVVPVPVAAPSVEAPQAPVEQPHPPSKADEEMPEKPVASTAPSGPDPMDVATTMAVAVVLPKPAPSELMPSEMVGDGAVALDLMAAAGRISRLMQGAAVAASAESDESTGDDKKKKTATKKKEEEEDDDDEEEDEVVEEDDSDDEREFALIKVMAATQKKRFEGKNALERQKLMQEDAKKLAGTGSIRESAKKDPRNLKMAKNILADARKAGVLPAAEEDSYHSSEDEDFSPDKGSDDDGGGGGGSASGEEAELSSSSSSSATEKKKRKMEKKRHKSGDDGKKKKKSRTKERLEESVRDIIPRIDEVYAALGQKAPPPSKKTEKRRAPARDTERDQEDTENLRALFEIAAEHLALKPNSRLARVIGAHERADLDDLDKRARVIWYKYGYYNQREAERSNALSRACYSFYDQVKQRGTNERMMRALDLLIDKAASIHIEPLFDGTSSWCTFMPGARATQLVRIAPANLLLPASASVVQILEAFHFGTHFFVFIEQAFDQFLSTRPTLVKGSELAIRSFCDTAARDTFANRWIEARHVMD